MFLQTTTTRSTAPASTRGKRAGLRHWVACFSQYFLAISAFGVCVFSYGFFIAASRYSGLFQTTGLTRKSSGLACGHPLTLVRWVHVLPTQHHRRIGYFNLQDVVCPICLTLCLP
jgi:hypothetical protein